MKLALAQIAPVLAKRNIALHLQSLSHVKEADVVLFPELSLNGYFLHDKVYEDAYTLEELAPLIEASKKQDIVVGLALRQGREIFNAALYLSQGEIVHIHHKNSLPNYGMFEEARYFVRGQSIEAFQTTWGKAVMLVCEDIWRASTMQRLAQLSPNIIYILASSPARGFEESGLEIAQQWNALLQTTALLTLSTVVFVNRVGFEDGVGFWGNSKIVNFQGKIIEELPFFETKIGLIDMAQEAFLAQRSVVKYQ